MNDKKYNRDGGLFDDQERVEVLKLRTTALDKLNETVGWETASVDYLHLSGLDFRIESSTNLIEWTDWVPAPLFYPAQTSSTNELLRLDLTADPKRFFRIQITEP